ncbi:MAG: hypothetical protein KME26_08060 [Oscillatoria princeps RMCB-10]|jgi:hypothetical protein|nr:hypothetical protein [Oscillatoria princeps RMCB-10]
MLENLSRDPPGKAARDAGEEMADPWVVPSPAVKASIGNFWKLQAEPHPLIAPAGNPAALLLPPSAAAPELSAGRVLLQDELKLRACDAGNLAVQIGEALGLLCWMGMVKQGTEGLETVVS